MFICVPPITSAKYYIRISLEEPEKGEKKKRERTSTLTIESDYKRPDKFVGKKTGIGERRVPSFSL